LKRWLAAGVGVIVVVLLALWLARAYLAAQFARSYFRDHGVAADVEIGSLGLSGVSGRFALGPAAAPDIAAERIELHFDPLRWLPYVVEVRLVKPVLRARIRDDGSVALGSLDNWLASLRKQEGKSPYVSDDLTISLTGLRAVLATPAGAVELDGDVKLVKNLPVVISLDLRPTQLAWRGMAATLASGHLSYESVTGEAALQLRSDVKGRGLDLHGLKLDAKAAGLRWTMDRGLTISTPSADLNVSASDLNGAQAADFKLALANLAFTSAPLTAGAQLRISGDITTGAALPVLHTGDARWDRALKANLARLSVEGAARLALAGGRIDIAFPKPLQIKGAAGGVITLHELKVGGGADAITGGFHAALHGGGLPSISLDAGQATWRGGGLAVQAGVQANFDYAMLRKARLAANGRFTYRAGRYSFTPTSCGDVRLAAFHPGTNDMAKDIRTTVCGSGGPLLSGQGARWSLRGRARGASAFLPLVNSRIDSAAARLAFDGVAADFHGEALLGAGTIHDQTKPVRFKPMQARGNAALARGAWRGSFAMSSESGQPLGDVTFIHTMATGAGTAHIAAPKLAFVPDRFQPQDLSPLLAAFRRADGVVDFSGDIGWTREGLTSRGTLAIASLNFLTPLGTAHGIKTKMEFTSLLPPQTAPGQEVTISRIDWTLPFSAVNLRFSFNPTTVKVDALATGWAEGRATVTPFTINLADPSKVSGTAELKSINLESLISASNLSSKLRLDGKISGTIPFTTGAEGIRITKGRIAADGPGRLSVSRSVWAQGEAAINSNAVQDFAYQALENLAFESMSADLNSVANGRLSIVFHIKGKSDPPKHQTADVAIADIINGTALYKPILLPSGTPVDLTLDTSLNFDELLKSYAEAWSKTLRPAGQPD
jgi:hypothetical protein